MGALFLKSKIAYLHFKRAPCHISIICFKLYILLLFPMSDLYYFFKTLSCNNLYKTCPVLKGQGHEI